MPSRDPLILAFRSEDTGWQLVDNDNDNDNDTIQKYTTSIFSTSWSRVIVVCWVLAILPAVPLMFNTTIWEKWENKTNCSEEVQEQFRKCYFPIDDVSFSYK